MKPHLKSSLIILYAGLWSFAGATALLHATDITWTSSNYGDWNVATNWIPNQVPGPGDNAIISRNVYITNNSDVTVMGLTLASGTLTGSGTLVVTGTMDWTGGGFSGAGAITITNGGTLVVSGTNPKAWTQWTINNAGTITWSGGNISSQSGPVLNNVAGAMFDVQGDLSWTISYAPPPVVNNSGTIQKSSGTGTGTMQVTMNNNGSLNVQSGTLSLAANGDSSGTFNVSAGAALNFGAYGSTSLTLESNSIVNAAGTIGFNAGTVDLNGGYSVSNTVVTSGTANFNGDASSVYATLSGGTLGGSGTLTVSGTMDWTGGTISGTGAITITNGGVLNISGSNPKQWSQGRTLNNAGTIMWNGGNISSQGGATLINQPGALFDLQGDQSWTLSYAPPPAVNNAGTLQKSTGTGTSTLQVVLNNNGNMDLQSGTVNLTDGGDSSGVFNVSSGATLNFGAGAMTLESNSVVSASGTVGFIGGTVDLDGGYSVSNTVVTSGRANFNADASTVDVTLSGGTFGGSGTFTVSGTMDWTGGAMSGTGAITITNGGVLSISGSNPKQWSQGMTLNNAGTITWSGGNISSASGATLNNEAGALFDLQGDHSWTYSYVPLPSLNNAGTFQKSSGTGVSTIQAAMTNNGTVDVQTGTIKWSGPTFAHHRNAVIRGSGTLDVSQTIFTTDGQFNPGDTLGKLTVVGTLPQTTNGVINIELGGTSAGVDFDQLFVTGGATLRGTLNISLTNGFQPSGGETFEVLRYGSHSSSFDSIAGLDLGGGFYLEPTFTTTNLVLTTVDNRPRPSFSAPVLLPNGELQFTLTGVAGQTFAIEASTNFVKWDPVLTVTNAGAVYDLIITDLTNYPYRFYRTSQP